VPRSAAYCVVLSLCLATFGCSLLRRSTSGAVSPLAVSAKPPPPSPTIPPITEAQVRAVQPVLDSLAGWIERLRAEYPELKSFVRQKALLRSEEGAGLVYTYHFTPPPPGQVIEARHFGPHGIYVRFSCARVPEPGHKPYLMAPPTRTFGRLGLHLWVALRTSPQPSEGLVPKLRAVLNAHIEMLAQVDRETGGAGAPASGPVEEDVLALLREMLDAKDDEVRFQKRLTLLAMGSAVRRLQHDSLRGAGPLTREEALLSLALTGGTPAVREALEKVWPGRTDSRQALQLLVSSLVLYDREVCGPIAELVEEAGERAIPVLVEALGNRRMETRDWATEMLGRVGAAAVPALERVLREGPRIAHFHAVRALRRIGGREAVPALVGALDHGDAYTRLEAACALGEIGDEAARAPLLKALDDPRNRRSTALFGIAGALGALHVTEAFERLAELAQDENWVVRQAVLVPLAQVGGRRALPVLARLLKHPDAETRADAAVALGTLRDAEAVPDLVEALDDPASRTAAKVAWALGEIGDPRAIEPLRRLSAAANLEVARAAAEALSRLED